MATWVKVKAISKRYNEKDYKHTETHYIFNLDMIQDINVFKAKNGQNIANISSSQGEDDAYICCFKEDLERALSYAADNTLLKAKLETIVFKNKESE
ncbi:MAG: hypothetical protein GY699_09505 [Desulfobacteraceae bacterium]|nr:hypothetical protein [Desulfobacteraceae bacterium]